MGKVNFGLSLVKALWLPEAKRVYGLSAGTQSKPESWAEATDTAGD